MIAGSTAGIFLASRFCLPERLPSRKAKLLNARMGRGELLDGHVEKGLILSCLQFADARTPRVEFFIPFEEQNDLGIIGDFFR